jgi:hypothetical protein
MNQYSYLPIQSYHPVHNKSGFIKGEGIRYVRLSSHKKDFNNIIELFKLRLLKRGYTLEFINKSLRSVKWSNRASHLNQKTKDKSIPFICKIYYNPVVSNQFLRHCLNQFSATIRDIPELPAKMTKPVLICYKAPPKLLATILTDRKKKGL